MSGIEEKTVTGNPRRIIGISHHELRIKHIYEIGATHGATGMSGFGFFNHRSGKHPDCVGRTVYGVGIHCCNWLVSAVV